jgi:coenzyme Q-binding protein COQ10
LHPRYNSSALEATARSVGDHITGPTLVTLDLAFAFSNPVHATISAVFFGQVSKLMVKAFEERCMEVYGPGNN